MRRLEMSDAMFVLNEQPSRNTQHIGMIFIFAPSEGQSPILFDAVLELFRRRVPLARCFREKLVRVPLDLDYPYWINDPSFDVEFHVRHAAVPRPGSREQFLALSNRIMSQPLDMTRPLWEAWYIEGLDAVDDVPAGSFALLLKMHHAAVDGISGMEMVSAILEDEEVAGKRIVAAWEPEDEPLQRDLLLKVIGGSWGSPAKLVNALLKTVNAKTIKREPKPVKPPKTKAPKTRFNVPVTPHKVLDGRSFPFADIKSIKDAVAGATVNDVVLGVVGGALRRYLAAKGELPDESLVVTVPISLRNDAEIGTGGNRLTFAFVAVGTDIADPVERIEAIGSAMRTVKEYNKAMDAQTLQNITAVMPGMLMGMATKAMNSLPLSDKLIMSNSVVTNVPGPMAPLTFLGARYVAGFAAGPSTNGVGLFHSVLSLAGVISIGFSACREAMSDPAFYGECIEESYREIAAATAGNSGGARRAGLKAKPVRKRKPASATP